MTTTMSAGLNDSLHKVSMMASSTAFTLPPGLAEALGHMQRAIACPEDVRAKIAALKVPVEEVSGTRGGFTTNWRGPQGAGGGGGGGGQHQVGGWGARGGGWGARGGDRQQRYPQSERSGYPGGGERSGYSQSERSGYSQSERSGYSQSERSGYSQSERSGYSQSERSGYPGGGERSGYSQSERSGYPGGGERPQGGAGGWQPRTGAPPPRRNPADRPRFGNKARADATVEDRMIDRIRDKMNKFSPMTYDATKGWLTQLLDSGETDFLTGFVELVFEKAAAEPPFTTLYARLITELSAAFPHLATELRNIFSRFVAVFDEAAKEPDAASTEYAEYLHLRKRRKFRRGYATFLAEVAIQGQLTAADIASTANTILGSLSAARQKEDQQQLCEEYADCLTSLVKGCTELLRGRMSMNQVRLAMDRTGAPSLTPKARFALMDIVELFS